MKFGPDHIIKVADDSRCLPGTFRQKTLKPGLRMILAKRNKRSTYEPVGYRFAQNMFTAEEVTQWCKDHQVKKYDLGTGDLEPVVPAVQQTPSPRTMETPQPPKTPPPPPPEEKEEVGWIAMLRDLEDFQEDTLIGKDVAEGIKSIIGDLVDGSKAIVWAIVFSSSFSEQEANQWLTDSTIHAAVLPLDDLDDDIREIVNPGPGPEDMPWNPPVTKIFKIDDQEMRLVTGVILQPDEPDSQGDVVDEEEIVECAHNFMADYRKQMADMGVMHKSTTQGVQIVESSIAPQNISINGTQVKAGSWIVTCKIKDDKIWQQIKSGELMAFSIGGRGQRTPIE